MVNELKKNVRTVVAEIYMDIKELMDDAAKGDGGFDAMELSARQAAHWSKLDACFEDFRDRVQASGKKGWLGR